MDYGTAFIIELKGWKMFLFLQQQITIALNEIPPSPGAKFPYLVQEF